MRAKLKALSPQDAQNRGLEIQSRVLSWPLFEKAKRLGLYAAYRNEAETRLLFESALRAGKQVALPKVTEEAGPLEFFWVDSLKGLVASPLGPLCPAASSPQAPLSSLEMMVVPGLAFDEEGGRLGRGKGFYDRTLSRFSGPRLGLAYSFQVLSRLPRDPWDEGVHWVATEENLFQVPS